MNSYYHGKSSAKKWGGESKHYKEVHDFLDHTKAHVPDMRHRSLLHNSWGIYVAEMVIGETIEIPGEHATREVPVRLIAERHIIEDLGRIPTVQDYLTNMAVRPWMAGDARRGTPSADHLEMPSLDEMRDILKL